MIVGAAERPKTALARVGSSDERRERMPPQWPVRLQALCLDLREAADKTLYDRVLGEIWLLVHARINGYLQFHAFGHGRLSLEEREDIASSKALQVLNKIRSGQWDLGSRHPGEVAAFLSRVARHGLLDQRRVAGRQVSLDATAWPPESLSTPAGTVCDERPDLLLERKEYAAALRTCAGHLRPRAWKIWFLRAFFGLSSKEIALHPDVRLRASHVDVLLLRARAAVRTCMRRSGYDAEDIPPGAFIELWDAVMSKGGGPS
jgi:DNA-directed RNA polymerase specialized sigma24 family protein